MTRQGKVVEKFSAHNATEEKIMYAAIQMLASTIPTWLGEIFVSNQG